MALLNRMMWFTAVVLLSLQSWAQVASPSAAPAPSPKPAAVPDSSAPLSGVNLSEFDTTTPGQLKWENNPFVRTTESVGMQDMRLMAIVYRPGNAAALINGRIVKEGDRIGENQVVHVEAKRVVMRNSDGIFSLTMSGALK